MSLVAFRRLALRLAAGAAVALFSVAASAADAGTKVDTVAKEVIDIIKTKTGADRQAAIRQIMQANFDLPYMGQAALGTHWNQATEAQRTRFLAAVETAEARAYSERFGQYSGQTLSVGKVTTRPNGISVVESKLNQTTGQPIRLEWELRDRGQGLRVTDVKVEGVSLLMTRRSDFNSYIQNNGGTVEPLIKELEARAAR